MQQCRADTTQHRHVSEVGSSQEEDVEPHQRYTEIDKDLAMYGHAQLPAVHGGIEWRCITSTRLQYCNYYKHHVDFQHTLHWGKSQGVQRDTAVRETVLCM